MYGEVNHKDRGKLLQSILARLSVTVGPKDAIHKKSLKSW